MRWAHLRQGAPPGFPRMGGGQQSYPVPAPFRGALRHCWHCRRQRGTGRAQCVHTALCEHAPAVPRPRPQQPSSVLLRHAARQALAAEPAGGWRPAPQTGHRAGGAVLWLGLGGSSRVPPSRGASGQAGLSPAAFPACGWPGAGAPHAPVSEWWGAASPCSLRCGGAEWEWALRGHRARHPPR